MNSPKTITGVLIEAAIVGVCLIAFYFITKYIIKFFEFKVTELSVLLFITGALFHLVFEYTGLNAWYSREYCKLL